MEIYIAKVLITEMKNVVDITLPHATINDLETSWCNQLHDPLKKSGISIAWKRIQLFIKYNNLA